MERKWDIQREYWVDKVLEEAAKNGIDLEYTPTPDIDKANDASYKYKNCRTPIDFSLSISCENSLFAALLQIIMQGNTKQIYPIGMKDNHLHFLYY